MRNALSIDMKIWTIPVFDAIMASNDRISSERVDERDNPSQLIHRECRSLLVSRCSSMVRMLNGTRDVRASAMRRTY